MNTPPKAGLLQGFRSGTELTLLAFLAIAAFFVITEHRAHLFGIFPYALLFLSLLLFVFVRCRRGNGDVNNERQPKDRK